MLTLNEVFTHYVGCAIGKLNTLEKVAQSKASESIAKFLKLPAIGLNQSKGLRNVIQKRNILAFLKLVNCKLYLLIQILN